MLSSNTRFSKVDVELATIKGEMVLVRWMGGLLLTMVTAILFKLFLHWGALDGRC